MLKFLFIGVSVFHLGSGDVNYELTKLRDVAKLINLLQIATVLMNAPSLLTRPASGLGSSFRHEFYSASMDCRSSGNQTPRSVF